MSTTPHATPTGAGDDAGLSADEARELLSRAGDAHRTAAAPIPAALITFGILCVVGSFMVLGMHLAAMVPPGGDFDPDMALVVLAICWVVIAIVCGVLFRERWRRGMARRWFVYMGIWGVLWIAGMILSGSFAALIISPLFLPLCIMAVSIEAQKARDAAEAGR